MCGMELSVFSDLIGIESVIGQNGNLLLEPSWRKQCSLYVILVDVTPESGRSRREREK